MKNFDLLMPIPINFVIHHSVRRKCMRKKAYRLINNSRKEVK